MAYPHTNPERGNFVGGWSAPGDPTTTAHLWRCERDGQSTYFRADVWRNGRAVASFTAPTLDWLKEVLERKYGATGGQKHSCQFASLLSTAPGSSPGYWPLGRPASRPR